MVANAAPDALVAEVAVHPALRDLTATGAAYVECALTEPFRRAVLDEVAAGPFEPLADRVGQHEVRQRGEHRALLGNEIGAHPRIDQLCREVTSAVGPLDGWHPNDVSIQRYQAGPVGISPHLDGKRYRYVVAIFTLEGSAPLAICTDREGAVDTEWQTVPGSLVLLRGPGLGGVADGRPLHSVRGPSTGRRTSLSLRFDSRRDSQPAEPVR